MGVYGKAIITTAGRNLIAQALAGNESVRFTELKTSDYKYASTASLDALTDIPNVKQTTNITSALVTANSNVKVSAMIRNSGLTAAYYVNTIGIYGNTPGFPDTLIAVISAVTGDLVPAYSGSPYSFVFDVNLIIQNASNLNVSVNDAGVATVADLNALWEKAYDVYITNEVSGDVVTFPDGADMIPMKSVSVNFLPVQSFNGYSKPWGPGAGKNILDLDSLNEFKRENGIVFTHNSDGTITANGQATSQSQIYWAVPGTLAATWAGCILNGCVNISGCSILIELQASPYTNYATDTGIGANISNSIANVGNAQLWLFIRIASGTTLNNVTFKPMIRNASESDASYEPYSNICPINGWNTANITNAGKNLIPSAFANGEIDGVTYSVQPDGSIKATGISTGDRAYFGVNGGSVFLPVGNYILSGGADTSADLRITLAILSDRTRYYECVSANQEVSFSVSDDVTKMSLYLRTNGGNKAINGTIYPMIRSASITNSEYSSYNRATKTINLPTGFFGGSVDFVSGLVNSEWAEISNYSGESLPGEWLSSYDVYAPGTTPTNGAQVVYKRSTPVVTQVEPKDIYSVYGINTAWSDQNNIDVAYRADTKLYIDAKIAETQALALENS